MSSHAGPALAAFAGYERIKTRRDGSPLVELRMFAQRGFAAGMAVAITFFLGVASFALVLTLFLQQGLGFTALHAGATFIPFSAVSTWGLTPGLALAGLGLGTVFATAVEHALWFQVGVFGLAFLLMLALPARRGHNTPGKSV